MKVSSDMCRTERTAAGNDASVFVIVTAVNSVNLWLPVLRKGRRKAKVKYFKLNKHISLKRFKR
jgi:hypothetical protein